MEPTCAFVCKNCCFPLTLHPSIMQMDGSTLSELSNNLDFGGHYHSNGSLKNYDSDYDAAGSPLDEVQSASNSFLIIGDSMLDNAVHENGLVSAAIEGAGREMRISSKLFDIISEKSTVDHPLCVECADALIDKMDVRLHEAETECKDYKGCLEICEKESKPEESETTIKQLQDQVRHLLKEEKRLFDELLRVENKKKETDIKVTMQETEIARLIAEKDAFRKEHNYLKKVLFELDDERLSVDNSKKYVMKHLEILRKTNVFNAAFHIWYNGHFGTINGFRLGRLPNHPVDWTEINAAWGQTALLLYALARKIGITFVRYRVVPFGNHSFIETLEDSKVKELPLFGSGGFRYLLNSKFDLAMVAFLDCMKQVVAHIENEDKSWYCPYKMHKENIEDTKRNNSYSIKIQYNTEEEWTKALKYMLTNLKWILTWAAK